MGRAQYINANGDSIDLDDRGEFLRLVSLEGAGAPGVRSQMAATPNSDGEIFLNAAYLDARHMIATLAVVGVCSWAEEAALRQRLLRVFNPKIARLGRLRYWPDPDVTGYEIPCVYEGGLEFNGLRLGYLREIPLGLRAPDPTWRSLLAQTFALDVPRGGLSVPISFPASFEDATAEESIVYPGSIATAPIITITMTSAGARPRVENATTGEYIEIARSFAAGEVIEADLGAPLIETSLGVNLFPYLTAGSTLWSIQPGANTLRASMGSGSAEVSIFWYERFLGV